MDKGKEKRITEIFFNELGGMDNFLKEWKIIAKKIEKVKTDTEQDFIPTLESMKAYLQSQGLILPKNFKQFWYWFVIKYSDELDKKGVAIDVTQDMINDFSREQTHKLNQRNDSLKENSSTQQIGIQALRTFPEYILHPEHERIAEALKTTFRGEKGKAIRLMLDVLADQPKPLITYENRQRKKIFEAMKLYFNRDIGSRQSIFDYKRNNDMTDYKAIETRVLYILKSIDNDK